jgi:hypothetical protein
MVVQFYKRILEKKGEIRLMANVACEELSIIYVYFCRYAKGYGIHKKDT